ncbi:AMP-binding protein [Nocardia salmonicida]|uniref:AMP-binding protein n=1 Tax=Nocardia salmonicida TaxID=53431 RepID=UPI003CECD024
MVRSGFDPRSVYLWTLPMFHCNGWCTVWAFTAVGGTHVCLPLVDPAEIWRLIDAEQVTHLDAAPTVRVSIANAGQAHHLTQPLTITTAGAPPSPSIIAQLEGLGAKIVHVYGLTETYGPYAVCEDQADWRNLNPASARGYCPGRASAWCRPTDCGWSTTLWTTCPQMVRRWARSSCGATT